MESASFLAKRLKQPPRVGIVLGSGLGEAARSLLKCFLLVAEREVHGSLLSEAARKC